MTTKIHGIANCDTVKKSRKWLAENAGEVTFHDFRKDGLDATQAARWYAAVGDRLINRKGTTWRALDAAEQATAADPSGAQALAVAHPALIKRPVVEWPDGEITVGFDAADWAARIP